MVLQDKTTYLAMSVPRETKEAEASIEAFLADVRELRVKHRIADVALVISVNTFDGPLIMSSHIGDAIRYLGMLRAAASTETDRMLQGMAEVVNALEAEVKALKERIGEVVSDPYADDLPGWNKTSSGYSRGVSDHSSNIWYSEGKYHFRIIRRGVGGNVDIRVGSDPSLEAVVAMTES